eukprot:TRINITY_DN70_c1_g1_i3.p1 TRINITY_DN70_c1_g1~~TRINITY_DN70_c1_g1_i3.p1  ORF type:complete len:335 (-),score=126.05 TRINITY_DN70_c1_g1_i3:63-1019(-)
MATSEYNRSPRQNFNGNSNTTTSENKVFVRFTGRNVYPEDLKEEFARFGQVSRFDWKEHFAFITYDNRPSAEKAVSNLNGISVHGTRLQVEMSYVSQGKPRRRNSTNCFSCGQEGHWSRDCPQKSSRGRDFRGPRRNFRRYSRSRSRSSSRNKYYSDRRHSDRSPIRRRMSPGSPRNYSSYSSRSKAYSPYTKSRRSRSRSRSKSRSLSPRYGRKISPRRSPPFGNSPDSNRYPRDNSRSGSVSTNSSLPVTTGYSGRDREKDRERERERERDLSDRDRNAPRASSGSYDRSRSDFDVTKHTTNGDRDHRPRDSFEQN